MTIEQLRASILARNYAFFEQGDYNLNIVAIRENDVFENTFSDTLHLAYKEGGVWKLITTPWTTLAGTLGRGGEQSPLTGTGTGTGVSGVAIIVPSQYRRVFKFVDNYWQWLAYPFFQQIGNMQYWRDNNKNGVIDKGKIYVGNYATNLHRMGNNGVQKTWVNSQWEWWSQGCNGSCEPDFKKILAPTREAVKKWGNIFSYTMLERAQIIT